jgi:hypothetical protein
MGARVVDDEHRCVEGAVELVWDPQTRLAILRFMRPGVGSQREAERLTEQLETWTDGAGLFRLLVDCSDMVDVDAGWRATWGDYFKRARDRAVIGWFNADARIRLVIIMFKKGTGVTGEAFETEAEARAYVDEVTATDPRWA